jgi:CubicO group peptidase (beta-lactamase class C family)
MNYRKVWRHSTTEVLISFVCLRFLAIAYAGETLQTTNASRGNSESIGSVQDFLFLPQPAIPATYRHMADLFATRVIKRGHAVYPLPRAEKPLAVTYQVKDERITVDEFMRRNDVTGVLLIKNGKIALEKYGSGNTEETKWPSWSIAKSVTSVLVGAALKDGSIASLDDPVTKYLPQLKGSAYEGTTIKDLLQMSSGIRFNESYEDRNSDFSHLMEYYYDRTGVSGVLSLAKTVSRRWPPGTKFHYTTLDANIVGLVVAAATHKTLADYLSKKIWSPFGMEENATWVLDSEGGQEFGGALIAATLRDYGRFGEFMLKGGEAGGRRVLPKNWVDEATHPRPDAPQVNYGKLSDSKCGYGYFWWLYPPEEPSPNGEEAFIAVGIFGQEIYINRKEKFVGVVLSAWPKPWDDDKAVETQQFLGAAVRASK